MESLSVFLKHKPLYYKEIDHERVHVAYNTLKPHIKRPTTLHVVGTNGKGSTGRMIAHMAWQNARSKEQGASSREQGVGVGRGSLSPMSQGALSVGHFSSPHILRFNERIWIDGADASDAVLEVAHERLYRILGQDMSDALSYFEYTTLLALVVFEDCDLMVLEAGLGGEYDATNVCDKELSVFTPIGIDHQAFLGETIEEIASTKLRSMQHRALLAPQPYPEVETVAKEIAADYGAELRVCGGEGLALSVERLEKGEIAKEEPPLRSRDFSPANDVPLSVERLVLSVESVDALASEDQESLEELARTKGWPDFLVQNARVAMAALGWLEIPFDMEALRDLELFGRFYPWRENVRIDVGHNPLAARAIVEALLPQTVLIYNALSDKDAPEVLRILAPKLKRVEIIPIETERATDIQRLEIAIDAAGLPYCTYENILSPDEHYLVFGSFYVVEAFLRQVKIKN